MDIITNVYKKYTLFYQRDKQKMALMIRASKENEVLIRKKAEELGESANSVANKMINDVEYHKKRREASFRECQKVKKQNEILTDAIDRITKKL